MTVWTVRLFRDAVSLLCLACLVWGLIAAPVPKGKKIAPKSTTPWVGTWNLVWQGSGGDSVCTFHAKGGFTCLWYKQEWIGSWTHSDGVLTVTECIKPSRPDGVPSWLTWKVALDKGGLTGRFANDSVFQLIEVAPAPKPDS